jgi:hypothetical protein
MTVPTRATIIFSVCPLGIREAGPGEQTRVPAPRGTR